MKKLVYLNLLLLTLIVISCSSEKDDYFQIPEIPGENVQPNEFQLVFRTTAEEKELVFSLQSSYGEKIYINWGDDNKLHEYDFSSEISHVYPQGEEEYTITIKASRLSSLDLTHEKSANLTGVYFGECPELMNLKFNKVNKFSAFDLRKCPQFKQINIHVNTADFDWSGLRNAETLIVELHAWNNIDLTGFPYLSNCYLYLDRQHANAIESLKLTDVPLLTMLELASTTNYGGYAPYISNIGTIEIDAPLLKEVRIYNIGLSLDADFSKLSSLKKLDLFDFTCGGDFKLNPNLETLLIRGEWEPKVYWRMEELDLSDMKKLKHIMVEVQPFLKSINLSGAENLYSFWLQKCNTVTELLFEDLPDFHSFYSFSNSKLTNIIMKQLPELATFDAVGNPELSSLEFNNTPKVWNIDISGNKLSADVIKSVFSSLPQSYTGEDARRYYISGNPGDIPEVHEYIRELDWKLDSYGTPVNTTNKTEMRSTFMDTKDDIILLKAK